MVNFIIPATMVRRGYQVIQDRTMRQAFPGMGKNITRRDFSQYQEGKILSWNMGYTQVTETTAVYGSGRAGA